ncbi:MULTISPECIES: hypothetical protein [Phyllobacterium]|jgi:hypothetical protein|uniref:Uncharacterized protein n=1 Tax=Phyllobacterium sophorae TaxID=1520277 RepID=A0A2P7B4F7_9HYPH|nr:MULTISPECIES: hypothetical protein [Phyllobacterium]PSH61341.1 hypothetical protein CU103_23545 [Phyllobacterium sophorae]UXN63388.1 hypothetical protein N8E89_12290 [Phyllobacterium sp. A18/5-2]
MKITIHCVAGYQPGNKHRSKFSASNDVPVRAANIVEGETLRKGWFHKASEIRANLLPRKTKYQNAIPLNDEVGVGLF